MQQAELGIEELRKEVDTLIVIPNDRLLQLSDRSVSVVEAFRAADTVLLQGVGGITDIITTPGLINLDFADVKSVMQGAGGAFMGIGRARGEDRAIVAAEAAIASPLLEASIEGARGVLLSIAGGSDLGLFEVNDAARLVQDVVHPDANIIWGTVIDEKLGDEVRVTVIAAGFDNGTPTVRSAGSTPVRRGASEFGVIETEEEDDVPSWLNPAGDEATSGGDIFADQPVVREEPISTPKPRERVIVFDENGLDDDIDVPDFLK
jgi:cell division protein FtsZ